MSEKTKKETKRAIWPLFNTVLIFLALGLGYVVINKTPAVNGNNNEEQIRLLQNKIAQLENVVRTYGQKKEEVGAKDLAALNEKIDNVGKINLELLEAKASMASVAGVTERMDRLEFEVQKLGHVSSQGALILTAAGLVEEAAKKHEPFMYEASVLEELSRDTPMEKSAHTIAEIAVKGLPLREDLIEKFIKMYELSFVTQKEPKTENLPVLESNESSAPQSWVEKLKEKISSLIVVERIKEPGEIAEENENASDFDEVYRLVRNGEFETAILKMNVNPKYQTENFEVWIEEVRAEKVFDKEMSKIKALTLGVMKAQDLK